MQSFSWYVNRLGRMSGAEVAHRLSKAARGATRLLDLTRVATVPQRDPSGVDRTFLPAFVVTGGEGILRAAERTLTGRHDIFDLQECDLGDPPDWNRDPLTGTLAPWRAAASIDHRDQREVGNIKYLWEPNRHLHLATLAQAHALTGEARYAQAVQRHVESWLMQCPVGRGPNWTSALELGIRLINWSVAWQLLGGARSALFVGHAGEAFRDRWLGSVFQHVQAIVNNLSRFSSANNHLIGETAGVYVAAVTWPLWPQLRTWGAQCRELLQGEALRQNAPDGGNREQALAYQQFVLDFLLLSGLAARAAGEEFPATYWQRVERMTVFLASMLDVAGNAPMIGDADDGFVVRLSGDAAFCPYRSLVATGAVLFDRADLARKAGTFDLKSQTLLGSEGERAFAALASRPGEAFAPLRSFPDSGYYLLGDAFETAQEVRVLTDAGPLGYLSLAAHGHADALALLLNIGGREILIDPGTYAYHTETAWRRYFRGTSAHNTLGVDDLDQSEQRGNFMWSHHAHARCLEFASDGPVQRFVGEHDGYARLRDPVIHRREVSFDREQRCIEIVDTLTCRSRHRVCRSWHFAENLIVTAREREIRADAGTVMVTIRSGTPIEDVRVQIGAGPEEGGWVSRRFYRKSPCTTVRWQEMIDGPATLRTRITWILP
jgi:hypothetical protein